MTISKPDFWIEYPEFCFSHCSIHLVLCIIGCRNFDRLQRQNNLWMVAIMGLWPCLKLRLEFSEKSRYNYAPEIESWNFNNTDSYILSLRHFRKPLTFSNIVRKLSVVRQFYHTMFSYRMSNSWCISAGEFGNCDRGWHKNMADVPFLWHIVHCLFNKVKLGLWRKCLETLLEPRTSGNSKF